MSVEPALTAKEWEKRWHWSESAGAETWVHQHANNQDALVLADLHGSGATDDPEALHALAALALHKQPFGFTWEDVDAIRSLVGFFTASRPYMVSETHHRALALADRIAALLPPR